MIAKINIFLDKKLWFIVPFCVVFIEDNGYPHDGHADKDPYPHDGRANKDPYPHDRRADKNSYPHDSNNQCIILRLQLSFVMINMQLMRV